MRVRPRAAGCRRGHAAYGLGKAGWVRIPPAEQGAPAAELLCDWVEESYRAIAPKRLIAELDER